MAEQVNKGSAEVNANNKEKHELNLALAKIIASKIDTDKLIKSIVDEIVKDLELGSNEKLTNYINSTSTSSKKNIKSEDEKFQ